MEDPAQKEPLSLLEMPNGARELEKVAEKQAKRGIDHQHIYGTAGSKRFTFSVSKTDDETKSLRLINNQTLATSAMIKTQRFSC